jgi:adenylate cyclase
LSITAAIVGYLVLVATVLYLKLQSPAGNREMSKPSLAVLRFDNLSNDPTQDYFTDGIADDLVTDLSMIAGLFITARSSSFDYQSADTDFDKVADELGVRYLLMGSVRKSVNKVRINARLIDSANGQPVWTHRYDRKLTDIFEIQDEVTKHIVNELSVRLTKKEERRLNEATTRNIDAYDVFLQGQERVSRFNPIDNAVGREFFEKAKRLDPGYARAHAGIALTHFYDQIFGWSADKAASIAASLEAAELALALDSELPHVYVAVGSAKMGSRQFDEAVDYLRRSIEIAPNYADGHAQYAAVLASAGKNEEALKHIDIAMQLNPHYSYIYLYIKSLALFYLRQLEDTLPLIEDTVLRNPEFDRPQLLYASTLGHLGQIDEAEWALMEALTLSPDLTLADELANHPYKRQEDKAFYIEGLRKAGLQ